MNWKSSAISILLLPWVSMGSIAPLSHRASAQDTPSIIVPDTTLLTPQQDERSIVISNFSGVPIELIVGGAIRGSNLFHSFEQFNVSQGRAAYFGNPNTTIQNILARVTGQNRSEILGTLGILNATNVTSRPNLFLINPNGIIFGSEAQLDIQGSFFGTTADAIQLGKDGLFNVADPSNSNLLTVEPSALFLTAQQPKPILNRGANLAVLSGHNLLLAGGVIQSESGLLDARGGKVEIISLAAPGIIQFAPNSSQRSVSSTLAYSDIVLNNTILRVSAEDKGNIYLTGRDITLLNSSLNAGIVVGRGRAGAKAGDVVLDATGTVELQRSTIQTRVNLSATGDAGDIKINARSLSADQTSLLADTFGNGNAGNVMLTIQGAATFKTSQPTNSSDLPTEINTSAFGNILGLTNGGASGKSGNITIQAGSLFLLNGTRLRTASTGNQPAGNVEINLRDQFVLDGKDSSFPTQINSTGSNGGSGKISITAGSVAATNIAVIASSTNGAGNAGDIQIKARDAILLSNGALIQTRTTGSGKAGAVHLQAENSITLDGGESRYGGVLSSMNTPIDTPGDRKAGEITLRAPKIEILNAAFLNNSTSGEGNAGNIVVQADNLRLSDNGVIVSSTGRSTVGNGGDIVIRAGEFLLLNGSQVDTSTRGRGNAGNIDIKVQRATVIADIANGFASEIFSTVEEGGRGNGGDIRLQTGTLTVTEGGRLATYTLAKGDAGTVSVEATGAMLFSGTGVGLQGRVFTSGITGFVAPFAVGKGSSINIQAQSFTLLDGAALLTRTLGQGDAGNIQINATEFVKIAGVNRNGFSSRVFTGTDSLSQGGSVEINTPNFEIADGAVVNAQTRSSGAGGNLTINTRRFAATGGGQLVTTATGLGQAGTIRISASDEVQIMGSNPNFEDLLATFSRDEDGNNGPTILSEGAASGVYARTESDGNAGSLRMNAGKVALQEGAQINLSSEGNGNAGSAIFRVGGRFSVADSTIVTRANRSSGGEIDIAAGDVRLFGNSNLRTDVAQGGGSGGNITLTARSVLAFDDSNILAFAREGRGGNITLNTLAFFGQNYRPAPPGSEPIRLIGNGQVDINASGSVAGIVTLPDTTFIQNSLSELSQTAIDTNTLLANTCITRNQQNGSFYITGTGGLPINPGEISNYSTGTIQPTTWKRGDAIVEPQGVYSLPNGQLIMSRECD